MLTFLLLALAAGLFAAAAGAAPASITEAKDRQIVDAFLRQTEQVPAQLRAQACKRLADEDSEATEAYTWRVMPYLRMTLTAYELTQDAHYLDLFVQSFDNMRAALTKGPDGYLGWYGKVDPDYGDPKDPDHRLDAVISSFSVAQGVGDFVCLIDAKPELREKYAEPRRAYLDLVENQLVKKHDVRGDYVDLGKGGAIYRTPAVGLKPDSARLTLPHNKHSIVIRGFLSLYRATGKDEYLQRAVKLGTRFKRSLVLKGDHYEWNYWDPAGEWDVHVEGQGGADASVRIEASASHGTAVRRWKHWMGVEHRGGYYSSSVSQAVALYQFGLVFDATDLQRFLRTQLKMCWNRDEEHPVWSRVDGTRDEQYTQGAYIADALAPYCDTVASFLYTGKRQDQRLEKANDDWDGGPVANGWVRGKFLDLPAVQTTAQRYWQVGRKFLDKPANQGFVAALKLDVTPPGCKPPTTPDQMKP